MLKHSLKWIVGGVEVILATAVIFSSAWMADTVCGDLAQVVEEVPVASSKTSTDSQAEVVTENLCLDFANGELLLSGYLPVGRLNPTALLPVSNFNVEQFDSEADSVQTDDIVWTVVKVDDAVRTGIFTIPSDSGMYSVSLLYHIADKSYLIGKTYVSEADITSTEQRFQDISEIIKVGASNITFYSGLQLDSLKISNGVAEFPLRGGLVTLAPCKSNLAGTSLETLVQEDDFKIMSGDQFDSIEEDRNAYFIQTEDGMLQALAKDADSLSTLFSGVMSDE